MVKLRINEENLKNARTSETFPGTSPIFAISSNDSDSSKTNDSSNKDVPSSTTRRWTQVLDFSKLHIICINVLFKLILLLIMTYRFLFQVISLLPVYLLQISYGMNTGYPAIITPQLEEPCSEFNITADQESWIGM